MLVVAIVMTTNIALNPVALTQEETRKPEEKAGGRVLGNTSRKEFEKEEIQKE